jgi:hypothetical protein
VNQQTSRFFGNNLPTPTPKQYTKLDAVLNQVVTAYDPSAVIKDNHLAIEGNNVKVFILVKDDSFIFLPEYGKQDDRTGKFIQATVTMKQLETLAKNPHIESIQAMKDNSNLPKGVRIEDFRKPASEEVQNTPPPQNPTLTP